MRIKFGVAYSSWEDSLSGVSLGPLLCNIFLCNLFIALHDNYFLNYILKTKPYVIGSNTKEAL